MNDVPSVAQVLEGVGSSPDFGLDVMSAAEGPAGTANADASAVVFFSVNGTYSILLTERTNGTAVANARAHLRTTGQVFPPPEQPGNAEHRSGGDLRQTFGAFRAMANLSAFPARTVGAPSGLGGFEGARLRLVPTTP